MFKFIKVLKAKSKIYCGISKRKHYKYEEAIKCFDEALEIIPNYKFALYHKGIVYRIMDNYDEAFKYFDKALAEDPDFISAWFKKADAFIWIEKYDDAIACFERCLEIKKDDWSSLVNLIFTYIEKGDYESALKYANYNLKTHPKKKESYIWKAKVHRVMKDCEKSIQCHKKLTKLYPSYQEGWLQLAIDYNHLNQLEKTEKYLEKSLELDEFGEHVFAHALLFKDLGEYKKALKLLNRKMKVQDEINSFYLKGKLLEKLNNIDEAIESYNDAIELYEALIKELKDHDDIDNWKRDLKECKKRVEILQKEKTSK
jgi:tetratricopeptide (TPR) repeat protein